MKPKSNTHLAGNPSTSQRNQHAKLALGMKERVEMVGGQFDIDSAPGRPTTIHVTLPSQPTKRSRAKNPPCYDYDHCSHRR